MNKYILFLLSLSKNNYLDVNIILIKIKESQEIVYDST